MIKSIFAMHSSSASCIFGSSFTKIVASALATSAPHLGRHLRGAWGADQLGRKVLARKDRKHSVLDAGRQFFRPLSDSGRGHANGRRRTRDGSAEKFDSFGLEHGNRRLAR